MNEYPNTEDFHMDVKLQEAYYNHGYFNIKRAYDGRIDSSVSEIELEFGNQIIRAKVDWNANKKSSGLPRIRAVKPTKQDYITWIQSTFKFGEIMKVRFISPNKLKVFK